MDRSRDSIRETKSLKHWVYVQTCKIQRLQGESVEKEFLDWRRSDLGVGV